MKSGWTRFLITFISLIAIVNLTQSIYTLWHKGGIIEDQKALKAKLEDENKMLKKRLEETQTDAFVEKEARNKLNLQKEGEVVVIIPKTPVEEVPPEDPLPQPNWQKWWKLVY